MTRTRKSTPKYIVTYCGEVVYGPASKTDCKRFAGSNKTVAIKAAA